MTILLRKISATIFTLRALLIFGLLANPALENCQLLAQDTPSTENLRIVIIEGEGFTNNVKKKVAREEIVEVQDRDRRPIPGASITFALPHSGASGSFVNGGKLFTTVTDQAGRASTLVKPNGIQGAFKINVTAGFNGQTATASISQTNAAIGGAVGGGIGGAIAAHAVLTTVVVAAAAAVAAGVAAAANGGAKTARVSVGPPTLP